jgi:aminomethyltransferase
VWLRELAAREGLRAWVKESTDQLHNLAVQGPASRDVLREVLWTPPAQPSLDELGWFRFTVGRLFAPDGVPVLVSRTGYTGELGYEVWCHPDAAPAVWDAVWAAGRPYGLAPFGLDALDLVRIEAGLVFAGYEFDDEVDPFEAGIGFTVALKDPEDFVGRAALERRKAAPQRRLVGLDLAASQPVGHGDPVFVGAQRVGVVTSGCRSPLLGRHVALARVAVDYAELGTELEVGKIDGHQQRVPATVVRFPFYDPDKTRPRS